MQTEHIKHEGRECFARFYENLSGSYHKALEGVDQSKSIQERIEEAYETLIRREKSSIGHYFRNLYHIFKFIDESDAKNKRWYASIVRAQLSSHELCLLFYNSLMPLNFKFKMLIEKYAVLENMNSNFLLDKKHHRALYLITAYGEQLEAI